MPRNGNSRRATRGPRRRGNGGNTLDLTNFGQTNRRIIKASFARDLTANQVVSLTVGRVPQGLSNNPLVQALFGNDQTGWPLNNVRVKSFDVHFDCRGLGASGFNARPRCGAFMSGDILSAIDEAKIATNIEAFGGVAISPNQVKVVHVPVGPEFALGRFGTEEANSLVIYARGFFGQARVVTNYEVTGFPATRIIVADEQELHCGDPAGADSPSQVVEAYDPTQDWSPTEMDVAWQEEPANPGCSSPCCKTHAVRSPVRRAPK